MLIISGFLVVLVEWRVLTRSPSLQSTGPEQAGSEYTIMFSLESRRNSTQFYSLVSNCRLVCCKSPFKAGLSQLQCLSLSITFTSVVSPATGHILPTQQIPLRLAPPPSSFSISNLSSSNSRFSILLSSCDILIHCPHFLCYSIIFNSTSDKSIIYLLSVFTFNFICVCFIQQSVLHFCQST